MVAVLVAFGQINFSKWLFFHFYKVCGRVFVFPTISKQLQRILFGFFVAVFIPFLFKSSSFRIFFGYAIVFIIFISYLWITPAPVNKEKSKQHLKNAQIITATKMQSA